MSITQYSKYRRQGFRNAWGMAGMSKYVAEFAFNTVLVALVVMIVLSVIGMSEDWADSREKPHKEAKESAEKVLLACLNGKSVAMNGRIHICSLTDIGERL